MGLFDMFKKNKEKKLLDILNLLNSSNIFEVKKVIDNNSVTILTDYKQFASIITREYKNIKFNVILKILCFCYENNIDAFLYLLNSLINIKDFTEDFDAECYNLPTKINLKNDIHKVLLPFINILKFYDTPNHLTNDILKIFITNINNKNVLTEQEQNLFISVLNNKLKKSFDYINSDYGEEFMLNLLTLTIKFNNKETMNIMNHLEKENLSMIYKILIARIKLQNGIEVSKKEIEKYFTNISDSYATFEMLEKIGRTDLIPEKYFDMQEELALEAFEQWLAFQSELGERPKTIRVLKKMETDDAKGLFYVCAFTSDSDEKEMIGVTYTYPKGKATTITLKSAFSEFEELKKDYKSQIQHILDTINDIKF